MTVVQVLKILRNTSPLFIATKSLLVYFFSSRKYTTITHYVPIVCLSELKYKILKNSMMFLIKNKLIKYKERFLYRSI